jgi:hypothetical protein
MYTGAVTSGDTHETSSLSMSAGVSPRVADASFEHEAQRGFKCYSYLARPDYITSSVLVSAAKLCHPFLNSFSQYYYYYYYYPVTSSTTNMISPPTSYFPLALLALLTLTSHASPTSSTSSYSSTISSGQILTPGIAILDAPQPNTPLGGATLHVALDVTSNGRVALPPYADDASAAIHNVTLFLTSYETGRNFTISNGTATGNGATLGDIMAMEEGSTVKHVNWVWPDCLVGDGQPEGDDDSARGAYNVSDRRRHILKHKKDMNAKKLDRHRSSLTWTCTPPNRSPSAKTFDVTIWIFTLYAMCPSRSQTPYKPPTIARHATPSATQS